MEIQLPTKADSSDKLPFNLKLIKYTYIYIQHLEPIFHWVVTTFLNLNFSAPTIQFKSSPELVKHFRWTFQLDIIAQNLSSLLFTVYRKDTFWRKKWSKADKGGCKKNQHFSAPKKIYFFFIHIPIEPECSEKDNFDKKKVVADLPNTCNSKISMLVLTIKTQIY